MVCDDGMMVEDKMVDGRKKDQQHLFLFKNQVQWERDHSP